MDDSPYNKASGDEEEEEELVDETGYKTTKDAVIFAIDVSKSMLQKPPATDADDKKTDSDSDSATHAALKCAYQLMQQRIISNPNDMMGILLFGTQRDRFMDDKYNPYPHCYVLTELEIPDAQNVKKLRDLVNDEEEAGKLLQPCEGGVKMASVLFCANQIFTTKASNFASRRLFLVTDNDDPHRGEKALASTAAVRAKDLYDLGVVIELFPISKPDHEFDRTIFYDDIVYRNTLNTDENAPAPLTSAAKPSKSGSGISLFQSLLSNINSHISPRRALFSVPLELSPGIRIGVKGYILFKREEIRKSCNVWMGGEKPQIAVGSTTRMADDTARTVEKVEIKKAFKFGGDTVSFGEEELKRIKYFGDPVIRVIGFKDRKLLPAWANYKHSTLIYPSETDFVGSTRVFSALWQKMRKAKKFALVWFIPRRNATPVLAAAIPGEEKYGDDGEQVSPPGLWIVNLPFADDIRQVPETTMVPATDELVDAARMFMQQVMLPKSVYNPKNYPNPALQWFYRVLQAMALEEDLPETPEDKTLPRYRQIDKRAGSYVTDWGTTLESSYQAYITEHGHRSTTTTSLKKRPAATADGDATTKKIKTEVDGVGEEEMRERFENGTVEKLTLPVLKEFLGAKKIPVGGKKKDLVDRVVGYFASK
ncbi:putative DSB repair complex subunit Ku70 [Tothia fuscella]|uniref:ATP-dependent DNA helicase II subunit 1 n=1 Tax=Tothia fuscella TaxID=1048955 RepID=A0A9P4U2Y9_9PEZI|nr:putative DSB repair complex subunit Ku70 [Tothia fuscella]